MRNKLTLCQNNIVLKKTKKMQKLKKMRFQLFLKAFGDSTITPDSDTTSVSIELPSRYETCSRHLTKGSSVLRTSKPKPFSSFL